MVLRRWEERSTSMSYEDENRKTPIIFTMVAWLSETCWNGHNFSIFILRGNWNQCVRGNRSSSLHDAGTVTYWDEYENEWRYFTQAAFWAAEKANISNVSAYQNTVCNHNLSVQAPTYIVDVNVKKRHVLMQIYDRDMSTTGEHMWDGDQAQKYILLDAFVFNEVCPLHIVAAGSDQHLFPLPMNTESCAHFSTSRSTRRPWWRLVVFSCHRSAPILSTYSASFRLLGFKVASVHGQKGSNEISKVSEHSSDPFYCKCFFRFGFSLSPLDWWVALIVQLECAQKQRYCYFRSCWRTKHFSHSSALSFFPISLFRFLRFMFLVMPLQAEAICYVETTEKFPRTIVTPLQNVASLEACKVQGLQISNVSRTWNNFKMKPYHFIFRAKPSFTTTLPKCVCC